MKDGKNEMSDYDTSYNLMVPGDSYTDSQINKYPGFVNGESFENISANQLKKNKWLNDIPEKNQQPWI